MHEIPELDRQGLRRFGLVTGGIVVRPEAGGPGNIEGGLARRVVAGDAILIPEGTPHQYTAVVGSVTYLEVRFNVPVE